MIGLQAFRELAARPQGLAAMDQRHGRTNFGQQQSILRRRIAAANDAYIFARKELRRRARLIR